jgi:CDP-diacylglycerol--glycerol-3-phosphate 3-phosphatidyltransferase
VSSLVPDPAAIPPQTVRLANLANALTMLRLLMVPVVAVLLLHDGGRDTGWRVGATVAFGVASLTDRLDGQVARRRGLVTELGKLADPIADKALTGTALVGLSVLGLLWWWVTTVILVREVGVTLLRFWVIRHGVIPASRGGKLKTMLQALAIGLYLLPLSGGPANAAAPVMAAALVLTIATGADYVARAVSLRRSGRRRLLVVSPPQVAAQQVPGPGRPGPSRPGTRPGTPGEPAQDDDHPRGTLSAS